MNNQVQVSGKTYGIRDLIKAKGGKWDAASKTWTLDASAWARIAALDHGRWAHGIHVIPATYAGSPCRSAVCPRCGTYCAGDCEAV